MDYKKRYPIGHRVEKFSHDGEERHGKVVGYWHDDNESGITVIFDDGIPNPVEFVATSEVVHKLKPRKYGDDDE